MTMRQEGKLIFITGGARSGKSRFAVGMAQGLSEEVVFVATCTPQDGEMRERVRQHRAQRPRHWTTLEEGLRPASTLGTVRGHRGVTVIDCLTLLVSNLLLVQADEQAILTEVQELIRLSRTTGWTLIVVSNEVGSGLVPEGTLGRLFRDVLGRANQLVAREADEVYLMVSGIPLRLK